MNVCAFAAMLIVLAGGVTAGASNAGGGTQNHPVYKADLTITDIHQAYNHFTGRPIADKIWIQVTNQGNGSCGTFGMWAQWGQGYLNQQMFFWFQGGIGAGQSIWVQVDADGYNLWAGNFYAWVDHTNSIAESNEFNNVVYHN